METSMLNREKPADISIELAVLRLFAAQAGTIWQRAPLPHAYRACLAAIPLLARVPAQGPKVMRRLSSRLASVMASMMLVASGDPLPDSAQFWLTVNVYDSRTGTGVDHVQVVDGRGSLLGFTQPNGSLGQWVSSGNSQQIFVEKPGYHRVRYTRFRGEDQISLALQPTPKPRPEPQPVVLVKPATSSACVASRRSESASQRQKWLTALIPETRPSQKKALGLTRTYKVKRGDSLWWISQRELGTPLRWGEISRLNHLEKTKWLLPGMKLQLPAKLSPASKPAKKQPPKKTPFRREDAATLSLPMRDKQD